MMNDKFSTGDFNRLCTYIKPLLEENYEIRIEVDPEGIYMVSYCQPEYSGEVFMLYDAEHMTLEGEKIAWIYDEDGGA